MAMMNGIPVSCHRPVVYTNRVQDALEAEFSRNQYPDIATRDRLAASLHLNNLLVHVWFQNRRLHEKLKPPPSYHSSSSSMPYAIVEGSIPCYRQYAPTVLYPDPMYATNATTTCTAAAGPPMYQPQPTCQPAVAPSFSVDFLSRSSRPPDATGSRFYGWDHGAIFALQTTSSRDS